MILTTKLGLKKPGLLDPVSISDLNFNSDKIDEEVGKLTGELDAGNSGTSKTIAWASGLHQKITLTGNCNLTFTPPTKPCMMSLRIVQDGVGNRVLTLPTHYTSGGEPLVFTLTANAVDILSMYYDGSKYYCQVMNDVKVVAV